MTAGCFILSGVTLLLTMAVVSDKGKHVMYFPLKNVRIMFTWTDSVCFHSPWHVCYILICINIYIYIYMVDNYDPLISQS